jgi:hypothetical protein
VYVALLWHTYITIAVLTMTDYRLPRRLHGTGHPTIALRRPRRHRPHFPRRRPAVAVLQQEPRRLATSKQCVTSLPYRRRWAKGGLEFQRRQAGSWGASHMEQDRYFFTTRM